MAVASPQNRWHQSRSHLTSPPRTLSRGARATILFYAVPPAQKLSAVPPSSLAVATSSSDLPIHHARSRQRRWSAYAAVPHRLPRHAGGRRGVLHGPQRELPLDHHSRGLPLCRERRRREDAAAGQEEQARERDRKSEREGPGDTGAAQGAQSQGALQVENGVGHF